MIILAIIISNNGYFRIAVVMEAEHVKKLIDELNCKTWDELLSHREKFGSILKPGKPSSKSDEMGRRLHALFTKDGTVYNRLLSNGKRSEKLINQNKVELIY